MKDYYERKRKAVEATVNEIHKARAAYEKQTSEINYTEVGLQNLEYNIKKELDKPLSKIRQDFINSVKGPVNEDLLLYKTAKAEKKAKMTKEDRILAALEFQNQVTMMKAKVDIVGDGMNLIDELQQIDDPDLFAVMQGLLIQNTDDENKMQIRSMKYVDKELAELQEHVNDLKTVEANLEPMFGQNYGGAAFDSVVSTEVFGKDLSDTFFK